MSVRRFPAVVTAAVLVFAGCGDGSDNVFSTAGGDDGTSTLATQPDGPEPTAGSGGTSAPATLPGDSGPRPIPATIIDLELSEFPRPAAEACADNTTTVEVAPGQSIAAAVGAAGPGSTIRVAPGTYREQPDEWLALDISTDNICIRSAGEAVIESSGQTLGISITADDIVLEGLVLRGFEVGIAIDGRQGETQRNLTIERTTVEDPAGEFREGIVVYAEPSGSAPVLDGLLLIDVDVDGIDMGVSCNLGPCEHVWVENTRIAGRGGSGGSGADAFAIEEGRQIVVVDSVVSGVAADGIDSKGGDVVVFGCRVFDVERNGIKLWRGGDVINTIVDGTGGDAAIVGEEPGTYRYLHSLFAHHRDTGYVATWSYDYRSSDITVEIVNSIFYDNSAGGFFVPDGASLSIRHSIFTADPGHKLVDLGDNVTWTFADLAAFESAGFGSGNLLSDPAFVDLSGHDYSTEPSSPARDAGESIAGLDIDAIGGTRVRGSGPDIGPVES